MLKINREEYEKLKALDDKWKWIARNENTHDAYVYEEKPYRDILTSMWRGKSYAGRIESDMSLFQFIKWKDSEPYNIQELIEGYEREETEVKKNKSLERKIHKELESWHGVEGGIDGNGINEIMLLIDQLDEPEFKQLDRKIKELESYNDELIRDNNQLRNELDNQEVLSQELPAVPRFVDEWYESEGKQNSWWNWFYKWGRDESSTDLEAKTIRWMQDFNEEAFVNMFLHGYTVKAETKYYAKIKGHELVDDSEEFYWNLDGKRLYIDNIWHDYSGYKTTKLTKNEWVSLGVNEHNADFVETEELEE